MACSHEQVLGNLINQSANTNDSTNAAGRIMTMQYGIRAHDSVYCRIDILRIWWKLAHATATATIDTKGRSR